MNEKHDQARDTCLWPLDACLKHDAATRAANGCPREPERWIECLGREPILGMEATALSIVGRADDERLG